jgi:hypothetical protein
MYPSNGRRRESAPSVARFVASAGNAVKAFLRENINDFNGVFMRYSDTGIFAAVRWPRQ